MSPDRRSETSRANLGGNIPERLAEGGTEKVCSVVPKTWVDEIDAGARVAGVTRSAWIRKAIGDTLGLKVR